MLLFLLFPRGVDGPSRELVFVIDSRDTYFLVSGFRGRYLVYRDGLDVERFDLLILEGEARGLTMAHYESRFSFEEYLNKKGIFREMEVTSLEYVVRLPLRLRSLERTFLSYFNEETGYLIDSLLFGRASTSSSALLSGYEAIGALFFLSGSGTILSSFLFFLEYVLALRYEKKAVSIVTFLVSLVLALLMPLKVGIARVVLGRVIRVVFSFKKRKGGRLVVPLITAFLLLSIDFHFALDEGFLVGYLLSFVYALSSRFRTVSWKKRGIYGFFLSVALLFPILLEGGEYHLLAPLYSFLLSPLVAPFHLFAFLSFLSLPFVSFLEGYSFLLGELSSFLDGLDVVIPVPGDPDLLAAFYYLLLLFFLLSHEAGLTLFRRGSFYVLLSLLFLNYVPFEDICLTRVSFIDVGQGDAILLSRRGHHLLVDTGGNLSFDMAEEVLIPYFRKKRVYRLDALVLTHGDYDHSGAAASLLESFPVGEILEGKDFPYRLSDIEIKSLNPYSGTDENESSLVLDFEVDGTSFLLMGDAGKKAEELLLEGGMGHHDVIKLGHHGSSTSSSYSFLSAVDPELAIVSAGEGNRYGHPDREVILRCRALGIDVRSTMEEGTIELTSSFLSPFAL